MALTICTPWQAICTFRGYLNTLRRGLYAAYVRGSYTTRESNLVPCQISLT
ncbi:hypothetical protein HanXRQr2_Chr04g0172461 [Helianthus annuus]|uniref:Uncharacterized protein n=1 Tax=Helianthus annuus TaxID=4232 RepID=A0A9K3NRQ5_HELAN|nr:hypothetical protein HanXRQr2_Chr04g0172461 [Helianthus annuus]